MREGDGAGAAPLRVGAQRHREELDRDRDGPLASHTAGMRFETAALIRGALLWPEKLVDAVYDEPPVARAVNVTLFEQLISAHGGMDGRIKLMLTDTLLRASPELPVR